MTKRSEQQMAALNSIMAEALADIMPTERNARCPECGGRVVLSVLVCVHVPVRARFWKNGKLKLLAAGPATETRKQIDALAASSDEYDDDREELHCEKCDWWCSVGDEAVYSTVGLTIRREA